jgi:flagellar basal body-associated protein FliL
MKKDVEKNFNWSIEHGDYERDEEATTTYQRKKTRKKRIKLMLSIILYICGVSIIAYFILRSF